MLTFKKVTLPLAATVLCYAIIAESAFAATTNNIFSVDVSFTVIGKKDSYAIDDLKNFSVTWRGTPPNSSAKWQLTEIEISQEGSPLKGFNLVKPRNNSGNLSESQLDFNIQGRNEDGRSSTIAFEALPVPSVSVVYKGFYQNFIPPGEDLIDVGCGRNDNEGACIFNLEVVQNNQIQAEPETFTYSGSLRSVPEPVTILGSCLVLGILPVLKKTCPQKN